MISEFRIEKTKADAVLTLSGGVSVRGRFFVVASRANDWGPERVKDLLNAEPGFFPFEVGEVGRPRTVLFNRPHLIMVTLAGHDEPQRDPGYTDASTRSVSVSLSNGTRVTGVVKIYLPQGRDRLSDYARVNEQFRYLEAPGKTFIINAAHIVELSETTGS
jgi:hypothetical protein